MRQLFRERAMQKNKIADTGRSKDEFDLSEKHYNIDPFRPEGHRFSPCLEGDKCHFNFTPMDHLTDQVKVSLSSVGINPDSPSDVGRFMLYDQFPLIQPPCVEGIEILPLQTALERIPEVRKNYYFKNVEQYKDQVTQSVAGSRTGGYFIRVRKGIRVELPVEAGIFMSNEMCAMNVHNIVVLEESAVLHLMTGCTAARHLKSGVHASVNEHFVGENASFTNTMIHHWGPEFIVRPMSATVVESGGAYTENYYSVQPPKNLEMNPVTHLKGDRSSARFMAALISFPGTYCNVGGVVHMTGRKTAAELTARAVNHGGVVFQKGLLVGAAEGARAHVDCSGLMLGDTGVIEAVPGLRAQHPGAKMSHEAAIGKIEAGAVNYLRSKGLSESQAVSLIVRGFLDANGAISGLSTELQRTIQEIAEMAGHG